VVHWKDRLEDDGASLASESALGRLADAVVSDALRALRRALGEGDLDGQWSAQLLLELVRMMRRDLRRGAWARLAATDRRDLRRALLVLGLLAHSRASVPLA
jgi:hypothetical protein